MFFFVLYCLEVEINKWKFFFFDFVCKVFMEFLVIVISISVVIGGVYFLVVINLITCIFVFYYFRVI